jgi:hypothetical protein
MSYMSCACDPCYQGFSELACKPQAVSDECEESSGTCKWLICIKNYITRPYLLSDPLLKNRLYSLT